MSLRDEVRSHGISVDLDRLDRATASWAHGRNRRRREADEELEALVTEIREQKGFENFMLPPSEAQIRQAAEDGPIIIINSSTFRCDAIIVEKHRLLLYSCLVTAEETV